LKIFLDQVASEYTTDDDGVFFAKALRVTLYLQNNVEKLDGGPLDDFRSYFWELEHSDAVWSLTKSTTLDYFSLTQAENDFEQGNAISGDLVFLIFGNVLLVTYAIAVLSRQSSVHSYGSLVVCSFVCIGTALITTYGFGLLFQLKFSLVVQTLAFLLVGLGIDDTFVLVHAWNQASIRKLAQTERVQAALKKAGTSIAVTSVTDLCAFLAGSITDVPAIRSFCLFAAIGVTLDFFLQITAFVGFMVLVERREAKDRLDCVPCVTSKTPESKCCSSSGADAKFEPDEVSPLTKILNGPFSKYLLSPLGKATVLLASSALLGVCIYGALQLEISFNIEWFTPSDARLQDTYAIRDEYFYQGPASRIGWFTGNAAYETAETQEKMTKFVDEAIAHKLTVEGSCVAWWPAFSSWVEANNAGDYDSKGIIATSNFYTNLDLWLDDEDSSSVFEHDLDRAVDDSGATTGIEATRISCEYSFGGEYTVIKHIKSMDWSRDLAATTGKDLGGFEFGHSGARAYQNEHIFMDGLAIVREQILQNVGIALAAVFVLCLLLLGSLTGSLLVFCCLLFINIEVLGSWYLLGNPQARFNYVTGINLVLSIGFSVDACVHMVHAFLASDGTRDERAKKAVGTLGVSVLNGGISTILVLLPLSLSKSYIFTMFFQTVVAIMVLGMWHGLFVVPVALSLIGPKSYKESRGKLSVLEANDKDGTTDTGAEFAKGTFDPRMATPV
jgi:predicted RND superfamily exporter protein